MPSIPEKSAALVKADVMPSAVKRLLQTRPGLDLETGKEEPDRLGGQAGYQSCQGGCVQRRFDLGELARIRQHHHQRKVWVGGGEGGRDEIRPLHGRKVGAKRLHELHGHGTTVEARERIIPGLAWSKMYQAALK